MIEWKKVEQYPDRHPKAERPLVLLWDAKAGVALGVVHRFADDEIVTVAIGYHGFNFTHYAEINTPSPPDSAA